MDNKKTTEQEQILPEFDTTLVAPFPYFGGKRKIASVVWEYLGDPKTYIEPFFGSGAVLLRRPPTEHKKIYEIVNDKDGYICNVWRSIEFSPEETARWCDWPVNHIDLHARRKELIKNEAYLVENLLADPKWHDPVLAGYWIWAASCWLGNGLTRQKEINTSEEGLPNKVPHLTRDCGVVQCGYAEKKGVSASIPHLTDDRGTSGSRTVYEWMYALHRRLRNVKVVCGDWKRVCGGNWQDDVGIVGIFFDPPYSSQRGTDLYHCDDMEVAKEVEQWCLERGERPTYRIVVAGYDDEYQQLVKNGWRVYAWKNNIGYSATRRKKTTTKNANRFRERLFISPHCLRRNLTEEYRNTGSQGGRQKSLFPMQTGETIPTLKK